MKRTPMVNSQMENAVDEKKMLHTTKSFGMRPMLCVSNYFVLSSSERIKGIKG